MLCAIFRSLERKVPGKSSSPTGQRLQCDPARPLSVPLPDWSITSGIRLRASGSIRASASGAAMIRASLDGDRLTKRVWRDSEKAILAAVLQD